MSEQIGFIGLGLMGRPMVRRLAEHYDVIAFDLDADRFEGLESVARAESVAEVASSATTILMSLPTTAAVEAVVLGDDGLLGAMGRNGGAGYGSARAGDRAGGELATGALVIDMSTTQPLESKRIAEALAERGAAFVDAPVSGGPAGAEAGTLSIMAGCDDGVFERAESYLSKIGGSVVRVGGPGSGGVAKLVNNMIVGAAFISVAEGFAVAAANGIDLSTLHEAIRGGWAGSKVLDLSAEAVSKGDFRPTGTVDLLSKDLGYARDLARADNIPIPVTAIVDEVFTAAKARGTGGNFQAVIIELWEKLLDRPIGANAAGRGTVSRSGTRDTPGAGSTAGSADTSDNTKEHTE